MTTRSIRAAYVHPPSTAEQRRRIHIALSGHRLAIARAEEGRRRALRRLLIAEAVCWAANTAYMEATIANSDMDPYAEATAAATRRLRRARRVHRLRAARVIEALAGFRIYCQGPRQ